MTRLHYRRPEPETQPDLTLPLRWHLVLAAGSLGAFWLFRLLLGRTLSLTGFGF
jgi:hypothetical protein